MPTTININKPQKKSVISPLLLAGGLLGGTFLGDHYLNNGQLLNSLKTYGSQGLNWLQDKFHSPTEQELSKSIASHRFGINPNIANAPYTAMGMQGLTVPPLLRAIANPSSALTPMEAAPTLFGKIMSRAVNPLGNAFAVGDNARYAADYWGIKNPIARNTFIGSGATLGAITGTSPIGQAINYGVHGTGALLNHIIDSQKNSQLGDDGTLSGALKEFGNLAQKNDTQGMHNFMNLLSRTPAISTGFMNNLVSTDNMNFPNRLSQLMQYNKSVRAFDPATLRQYFTYLKNNE